MIDSNWYVIKVQTGKEEEIASKCNQLISKEILTYAFVPKYKRKMKIKGVLQKVEVVMFSGYVFLETNDIKQLYLAMKKVGDFNYFIGRDDTFIHPIYQQEKIYLSRFIDDAYIINESIGVIENDRVRILDGPLVDQEGLIVKIDRRKYVAWVDIEFMGRTIQSKVGLDIIEKKTSNNTNSH